MHLLFNDFKDVAETDFMAYRGIYEICQVDTKTQNKKIIGLLILPFMSHFLYRF